MFPPAKLDNTAYQHGGCLTCSMGMPGSGAAASVHQQTEAASEYGVTEEGDEAAAAPSGRPSRRSALAIDVRCWGPAFLTGVPLNPRLCIRHFGWWNARDIAHAGPKHGDAW